MGHHQIWVDVAVQVRQARGSGRGRRQPLATVDEGRPP